MASPNYKSSKRHSLATRSKSYRSLQHTCSFTWDPHHRTRSSVSSKMTIMMGVTRSWVFCPRVISVMSVIGGTIKTTLHIILAMVNGVHLVIERTAWISQRLNDHWVRASFLHPLLFVVCVIDSSLVKTVTLITFIVAIKTSTPSVLPTKNASSVARRMKSRMQVNLEVNLNNTIAVGENAPFVNNMCTSLLANVTSRPFQKRRMIPK